jgi:erythromycin esterase-like protein
MARRVEIVRYLHAQKGFDVLVFEADFYALHEAWHDARRTDDMRAVMDQLYAF